MKKETPARRIFAEKPVGSLSFPASCPVAVGPLKSQGVNAPSPRAIPCRVVRRRHSTQAATKIDLKRNDERVAQRMSFMFVTL